MSIITSHDNWYQIDNNHYWSVFDTSDSPDLKHTYNSFDYLLKTGDFNKNIFIQLQELITVKPDIVSHLLDDNFYLDFISALSVSNNIVFSEYIEYIPAKLELIRKTLKKDYCFDSTDRIAVEMVIININSLDLLLKAEWPNLTLEEQVWPIYAHLLNFNNVFDDNGDAHVGRAASLYVMDLPSDLSHETLRYNDYIPCMRAKYGDVIPDTFFNTLENISDVVGGVRHLSLEMLHHLYSHVVKPQAPVTEISFDFDLVS